MPDSAILIPRQSADGFRNMAVDEYLLELCRAGRVGAALRFYEWEPPAVSLGYSQSFDLMDLAACAEQGIDVVRRITGGGALLHWQELTYCFVLRRGAAAGGRWPRETAGAVSQSLVQGLSRLGVQASARRRTRGTADRAGPDPAAPGLCFMSGAENEIEASGRKLAGCAHKSTREAFFSHGSVMTGSGHVHVARLVRANTPPSSAGLALSMAEKSISLSELLGEVPGAEEMESAFRTAFESVLGLRFRPDSLSAAGARLVEERAAQKRSVLAAAVQGAQMTGGAR